MKVVTLSAAVAATGSFTILDYATLSDQVATPNNFDLTEGVDWTAATSNAATATSLAAAITSNVASTLCTAVGVGAVVVITAASAGTSGNSITLASSLLPSMSISGNNLTGGLAIGANGSIAFTGAGRIKTISVSSSGANSLGVQVLNGQAKSATEYDYITGTSGQFIIRTYVGGMNLPAGCFIVTEANVLAVTIEYELH